MTTHDWALEVDHVHLAAVRAERVEFAPGGWVHLVCEVLAYADDEAVALDRRGVVTVTVHSDGSVEVVDDGRGTDTRTTGDGQWVRKPVAATQDVRFTEARPVELLPDGHPRRGLSVVAALSRWLVHTNHRPEGSWSQRYERGVPVTDLVPVPSSGVTGTGIRFLPDAPVKLRRDDHRVRELSFPNLRVEWLYPTYH